MIDVLAHALLVGGVAGLSAFLVLTPRARAALAVFVFATLLVSRHLAVPGSVSFLNAWRLLLVAFSVGVVRRSSGYERLAVGHRRLIALVGVYISATFVIGFVLASGDRGPQVMQSSWLEMTAQAIAFVALLVAMCQVDDPLWVARIVLIAGSVAASMGMWEWVTQDRFLAPLYRVLDPSLSVAGPLVERGGYVRIVGPFDRPLGYGVAMAMLAVLAVALIGHQALSRLAAPLAAVLAGVSLLTVSRSAVVVLAVGSVLVLLLARNRRVTKYLVLGVVVVLVAGGVWSGLRESFSGPETIGTAEVRSQRGLIIAEVASEDPWTGAGFGALKGVVSGPDNQFALTYAELGVLGLVVSGMTWLGLTVVAGSASFRIGDHRLVAVGASSALVAGLVASSVVDLFALDVGRVFFLLAALGASASLGSPSSGRRWRPSARSVGAVSVVAVTLGLAAPSLVARPPVIEAVFETWSVSETARSRGSGSALGETYVNTVCGVLDAVAAEKPRISVTCTELVGSSGLGRFRMTFTDRSMLERDYADALGRLDFVQGLQVHTAGPLRRRTPAPARTAALWLPAIVVFILGVAPWLVSRGEMSRSKEPTSRMRTSQGT